MSIESLIMQWFSFCETGDFHDLPIAENFTRTSPCGTINGKEKYLALVEENKDKFLGHRFEIHDVLHEAEKTWTLVNHLSDLHRASSSAECVHLEVFTFLY